MLNHCTRCVMPETAESLSFDAEGVCSVCHQIEYKHEAIDWDARGAEFDRILENVRGKYDYDCIVPFSGGKDSTFTLWYLVTQKKLKLSDGRVVEHIDATLKSGAADQRVPHMAPDFRLLADAVQFYRALVKHDGKKGSLLGKYHNRWLHPSPYYEGKIVSMIEQELAMAAPRGPSRGGVSAAHG